MDNFRKYLRILLPALFIAYTGCLIAFTHVHLVNGVTIVHSHPYQTDTNGIPKEEHGYAEFQLLHQLSTVLVEGTFYAQPLIALFAAIVTALCCRPVYSDLLLPVLGKLSLRAPPSL